MKNKNDKSALSNIPFSLSLSLIVAAIAIGIGAWNGIVEGLFCAPFIVLLWRFTQSRSMAFVLMFAYYLAAGRSLFHSAGVFFAEDANTVQTGATEHSFGSLPALCLPSPGHYVGVKLGILYGSWPLYFLSP